MGRRPPRKIYPTRLDRFLLARSIKPETFAKLCGIRPNQLRRYRTAANEPKVAVIRRFVESARAYTGDTTITANDMFPVDDDDDEL